VDLPAYEDHFQHIKGANNVAKKGLGELLVREELIDINQLEKARGEQKNAGGRLGTALVKLGYIDDSQLAEFLSKQYQVPSIDLANFEIDPEAIKLVPKNVCEKHGVIPVSKAGTSLVIAMADPSNIFVRDDLQFITRHKIEPVVAPEPQIQAAIDRNYASQVSYESIMTEIEKKGEVQVEEEGAAELVDVEAEGDDAPIIKFVNLMLTEAIKLKASDIHIEPYEKRFRVRYRIDGSLYEKIQPPPGIANAITSRLKVMSKLNISERRRPQDGRLKIATKSGKEIDFRVSVLPTLFGEKIVLRLLDKSNLQLDMGKLGFLPDEIEKFQGAINLPYGMVLITGPTGSGKTTTIYSALAELNKPDVNISTAEDPVEFNLDGINQVQMNHEIELDFSACLRSFLRQDPDIIMVGEIRDLETAEIAFKAALTGHLVVSTLHTNDAPATVNRLLNMGIEPFLVTSAINIIVAQRLVRKICSNCKAQINVDRQQLIDLGVPEEELDGFTVYRGEGCATCSDIGYKGRVAIYEALLFEDEFKKKVFENVSPMELKRTAMECGMRTLRQSALIKLKEGLTTIEEVIDNSTKD
jgi:type IV pilus assembly protein PilB